MMISEIHKDSPKSVKSTSLASITLPISIGMMLGPLISGLMVKYCGLVIEERIDITYYHIHIVTILKMEQL